MNPLAITAAPVQGGISEFTAPCAFDPINTFLSYNYNYNSYFPMARDGAPATSTSTSTLSVLFYTIKDGYGAGPHSYPSGRLFISPRGTLVAHVTCAPNNLLFLKRFWG